ncbi:MAG: hypothetical protein RQ872_06340 [Sulfolobaceae archaeon]|jgi:uncharacterized membrane protein|nr:hypothetical protein [Sulfolobaceae archaeon]
MSEVKKAMILGSLSGTLSFFLFLTLDLLFFLYGPGWWFNLVDLLILPVLISLLTSVILGNKFSFKGKIYVILSSFLVSGIGAVIIFLVLLHIHEML